MHRQATMPVSVPAVPTSAELNRLWAAIDAAIALGASVEVVRARETDYLDALDEYEVFNGLSRHARRLVRT